jgi:hypothetical protein
MLRLAICWLNTFIGYAKSGHVHNMAYIKDPTACWYGNPFNSSFPFTFLCNFTLGSNGIPMGLHSSIQKCFNISLRYLIWLMRRSRWLRFLFTSIPKKKCDSPRSFFSNFWLSFSWFAKICFDHCTTKWGHPHRRQWKASYLSLVHMTFEQEWFSTYERISPKKVFMGGDTVLEAIGKGNTSKPQCKWEANCYTQPSPKFFMFQKWRIVPFLWVSSFLKVSN